MKYNKSTPLHYWENCTTVLTNCQAMIWLILGLVINFYKTQLYTWGLDQDEKSYSVTDMKNNLIFFLYVFFLDPNFMPSIRHRLRGWSIFIWAGSWVPGSDWYWLQSVLRWCVWSHERPGREGLLRTRRGRSSHTSRRQSTGGHRKKLGCILDGNLIFVEECLSLWTSV